MDPLKASKVKHLYEVEHLTIRQISKELRMCTKTISLIIKGEERPKKRKKPSNLAPYLRLIDEWYTRHPSLKATQVYARLRDYGYTGKYSMVSAYTMRFRKKKNIAYHELEFLPGQCAQVDWMVANLPFGKVYGFIFILAWSRYLFVTFYPRSSMEFFLDGHIKAYAEMKGAARENWYDNLKSVVISRKPELTFNAQFVDYMSHMGVAIHACNPGKGNEKGRVERAIRDIRNFIEAHDFADLKDLNTHMERWRKEWNERVHRTTHRTPVASLIEEKLMSLPVIPYRPYRIVLASIGKTAFVEFDTNRYSVPTDYVGQAATICAYPDYIEILVYGRKIARHGRSFGKHEKIEHPSHREQLLMRTPHGKYERIYHLMRHMGKEIDHFLTVAETEGEDGFQCSYRLFHLLRHSSKEMLLSAVREACRLHIYTLTYIESLIKPPHADPTTVYPQNMSLLTITYEKRELTDYDHLA
jgi:transposase